MDYKADKSTKPIPKPSYKTVLKTYRNLFNYKQIKIKYLFGSPNCFFTIRPMIRLVVHCKKLILNVLNCCS